MKRSIDYIISDPEGNTTILVLSEVERRDYQTVAKQRLEQQPLAEQVGYIKTDENGCPVSMDMCGLEFCGNATRAFGFYRSLLTDPPARELSLTVSGCDHPLKGWIEPPEKGVGDDGLDAGAEDGLDAGGGKWAKDADGYVCGRVRVEMPVPTEIEPVTIPINEEFADLAGRLVGTGAAKGSAGISGAAEGSAAPSIQGRIVHMDGISHLVIPGASDDVIRAEGQENIGKLFRYIRDYIYETNTKDIPAFGVMFVDNAADRMNPIVYVRDVDTTYFEGSCASGSAAAACAQATIDMAAGAGSVMQMYTYRYRQPAGTLCVDVATKDGSIRGMQLYGGVRQSDVLQSEVE